MSIDTKQLLKMAQELEEAAGLEGTELGDYWDALAKFARYAIHDASENLRQAFAAEVEEQHDILTTEYEIVEEVEMRPVKIRTLQERGADDE